MGQNEPRLKGAAHTGFSSAWNVLRLYLFSRDKAVIEFVYESKFKDSPASNEIIRRIFGGPLRQECGSVRGTLDSEALSWRGACDRTMQPSWTLSRARPRRLPLHGSAYRPFSALRFNSEPISIGKFRLCSFCCASRSAAIALWERRAVTFIQVGPLGAEVPFGKTLKPC